MTGPKMSWLSSLLHFLFLLLSVVRCSYAIEDYELDLYDLVEEVNGTFYEFMGLSPNSESSDVRRAYRKLSLQIHPDKNKAEDAELKFRQLVGIYEILKSPEKREKYNEVLVNGLPTWRQPIYYYRKVRKFGFTESAVVLVVIVSIIHYAMLWAAYWEKCYEIDEVYQSRLKKDSKRRNHQEYNQELEEDMKRRKDDLVRPDLTHLLVLRLALFGVRTVINLPQIIKWMLVVLQQRINPEEEEVEEEENDGDWEGKKKARCDDVFSNMAAPEMAVSSKPVVYQDTPQPFQEETIQIKPTAAHAKKVHWTDADDARLARAMQKFPAGTALRWEKIAQQLNHSPAEILSRAKQIKSKNFNHTTNGGTSLPDISKKKGPDLKPQGGISTREEPQPAVDTIPLVSDWSQPQQKALESALASVPKTAEDRWGDISALVPDKTKAECIARYKYLAAVIRQRKATVQAS